jgi:c(7)-type cytochrome triheme protein
MKNSKLCTPDINTEREVIMKKFFVFAVAVCFVFSLTGLAMAVGKGKKIEYDEKTTGKVVFDGNTHAASKCKDCHPTPFKMKKGAKLTMADMKAGKSCGTCHDGKKAFGVKECAKCHKK